MSSTLPKKFEKQIENAFKNIVGSIVYRLPDQMSYYSGSTNPCDYLAYRFPILYLIECKTTQDNTLNWNNITSYQWECLEKADKINGVVAGFMIWFVNKDLTVFIPASELVRHKAQGYKSINYRDVNKLCSIIINGKKKRKFFDYDLTSFIKFSWKWGKKDE